MGKEQWKNTGKELGGAFEGLAKSLIRSVRDGADKVVDWAEGDEQNAGGAQEERTVFNDGTWRETGKDLGHGHRLQAGAEGSGGVHRRLAPGQDYGQFLQGSVYSLTEGMILRGQEKVFPAPFSVEKNEKKQSDP